MEEGWRQDVGQFPSVHARSTSSQISAPLQYTHNGTVKTFVEIGYEELPIMWLGSRIREERGAHVIQPMPKVPYLKYLEGACFEALCKATPSTEYH